MDQADRTTILRELPGLLATVQLTPAFLSQLQRLRVLPPEWLQELQLVPAPRDRCRRLLLEMPRRGPQAFQGLVRALLETGQLDAARRLKPDACLADVMLVGGGALPIAPAQSPAEPSQAPVHVPLHAVSQAGDQPDRQRPPSSELRVRPAQKLMAESSEVYKMTSQPRGQALVISNIEFHNSDVHKRRSGGEVDEEALPALLTQLGFHVTVDRNLSRQKLRDAVARFVKNPDHERGDMAVLAILTHGDNGVLHGVDSLGLTVEEVISCFSHDAAPALAGKPKWLIFQACRGEEYNRASRLKDSSRQQADGRAQPPAATPRALAEYNDIFLTYSTIPGYLSMRDVFEGTWLVQALCEVFSELAHSLTLSELHVRVHDYMSSIRTEDNKMQTAEDSRRGWRKRLYFNPGL